MREVGYRNHSAVALFAVEHNQMIDAVLLHQPQAVFQGSVGGGADELTRHNLGDAHPCRALVFSGDFVGNIALRNHTEKNSLFIADAYRTDLALAKITRRVVNCGFLGNKINFATSSNQVRYFHRALRSLIPHASRGAALPSLTPRPRYCKMKLKIQVTLSAIPNEKGMLPTWTEANTGRRRQRKE